MVKNEANNKLRETVEHSALDQHTVYPTGVWSSQNHILIQY